MAKWEVTRAAVSRVVGSHHILVVLDFSIVHKTLLMFLSTRLYVEIFGRACDVLFKMQTWVYILGFALGFRVTV